MSKITVSIKKKTKKTNILQEETIKEKKKEETKPKKITTITQNDITKSLNQQQKEKTERKMIEAIPLPEQSKNVSSLQQMLNRKRREEIGKGKELADETNQNDYDAVSIDDFGLAMLKGMGYTGKNN